MEVSRSARIAVAGDVVHIRTTAHGTPRPARVVSGESGTCMVEYDGRKLSAMPEGVVPLFDRLNQEQRDFVALQGSPWAEWSQ